MSLPTISYHTAHFVRAARKFTDWLTTTLDVMDLLDRLGVLTPLHDLVQAALAWLHHLFPMLT